MKKKETEKEEDKKEQEKPNEKEKEKEVDKNEEEKNEEKEEIKDEIKMENDNIEKEKEGQNEEERNKEENKEKEKEDQIKEDNNKEENKEQIINEKSESNKKELENNKKEEKEEKENSEIKQEEELKAKEGGEKNKEEKESKEINNNLKDENCPPINSQMKPLEKNEEIKNIDKKENIEEEIEEEEEEINEDNIDNDQNLIHNILLILYKDKVISEILFSQEFYMLYGFLLSFKDIYFKEEEKENFIVYKIISYLIDAICKNCNLPDKDFIEKKFNIMYNIYLLCCCHKFYNSLIKYYLERNEQINILKILYECLFKVNNTNNITSYKFNWEDLRKHSYNLISNIISLDSKYLKEILPQLLKHHNKLIKKKQGISTDFKLRDPINDKLIGLRNFGATCYLNSLFQQMFMNPLFSKDLYNFDIDLKSENLENSVLYNMQLGFANLKYSCLNVYPPYSFVKSFKKAFNGEPIQFGVQQDSDEFLTILCDELEKEAKKYGKECFLENSFKGKIANEIVSLDKNNPYYSKTDEDFYRVTLDIKGHKTLEEALDAYIKGEILDGENQYYVEKYKKKLSIRKSSSLKKLGNQIIIHLKRFEFDFVTFTNKKLNDYLVFPNEINFKKWTRAYLRSNDPNLKQDLLNITDEEKENLIDEKMNYVLTGILIHSGSSLQSGHYYSLIMDQESGKWYQFNDNVISEFNIEKDLEKECFGNKNSNNNGGEQFGRTAYLLFYTKKNLFRNEEIIKEININKNILNEVYKENINYLGIKTYTSNLYQDFLSKFVNYSFNSLKDTNSDKENSINKFYRNKIYIYKKLLEMNKKEKEKYENINKVDDDAKINKINEDEGDKKIVNINKVDDDEEEQNNIENYKIPENIEELIKKIEDEKNNDKKTTEKNYSNKNVIKLLVYYTFNIAIQYFDNNSKISSFLNILNNHISSNKIFCISIIKLMEKHIDFFSDLLFKCGSKSQDMMSINKEIYDFFKNIFENVYNYEKENLKIISKKFTYIAKNKNSNKYEIMQEYESSLFRFINKLFINNLERCRKEYALDLMFLHLFYFCVSSFPEISILLEDKLIPLISFITNNSLNIPYFKSAENPTFYMNGNKGCKVNENYEKIFSEIIMHSINNGMYIKKQLSPYFVAINPNYYSTNYEDNNINKFDLYPKLPKNINLIFNEDFIIKYLSSHNCTNELICHLCYEDEEISTNLLIIINNYLRQINNKINTVEIIFTKICSLFTLNDSLTNIRLETLFQLNSNDPQALTLFDYYYNVKESEFVLDIIYNLSAVMYQYSNLYQYFYNNKNRIQWISPYIYEVKEQGFLNDNYNKVNSYHQDFMQIIEEGFINRLGFNSPAIIDNNNGFENGNNFMDDEDDDGFNLM